MIHPDILVGMSRTERKPKWRYFARESKINRVRWTRRERARAKRALMRRDYDEASRKSLGTEGWLTW
jgi:hypothetical protein